MGSLAVTDFARSLFQPVQGDPYKDRNSPEFRFRAKRFIRVRGLIEDILAEKERATILDLGGTETYWQIGHDFIDLHRSRLEITLLNPRPQSVEDPQLFKTRQDSATDPFLLKDHHFDLVHSNSVIEHVGSWPDFETFARNVRRLAPRYFVQTPNYRFPYEPHFRFPGFQFLPRLVRAALLNKFELGFFSRVDTTEEALHIVDHHRLLSSREMSTLFPDSEIHHEVWKGFTKSLMAIRSQPSFDQACHPLRDRA